MNRRADAAPRVFACGGVRAREGDVTLRLDGREADLVLQLAGLSREAAARVPDALVDALEIATYVWGADLATPRGRATARDLSGRWRRRLRLAVPVRAPATWARPEVAAALGDLLRFVSDDEIVIEPHEAPRGRAPIALVDRVDPHAAAPASSAPFDEVLLFSGGVDSTAGAVSALSRASRGVALVTHDLSPASASRLSALVSRVRDRADGAQLAHVAAWIQPRAGLARERSQRTRAFLWAALSAVVAAAHGADRACFYENGVVSFGLPIAAQVLGARAPRTTHPRAMHLAAALFEALGLPIPLDNPFLWRTKTEVVRALAEHDALALLEDTMSCGRFARGSAKARSCGLCSACIDRRFATLAAGAAEHDPSARYELDLLIGARPPGPSRALVESYVRAAMELEELDEQRFFARFGEAAQALRVVAERERASVAEVASRIVALHRRHGEQVQGVLDEGVRRHARALLKGRLPKSCLLRVCLPQEPEAPRVAAVETGTHERRKQPRVEGPRMPIRVLHLSDFHFSPRRGWDQDPVVTGLAADVARLVAEVGAIDLVALTGDVADRAAEAEYDRARAWIEGALLPAAGVPRERLLIVPGNHDVDRGAVNRAAKALQRDLLEAQSQEAIAEVLADAGQRGLLLARHQGFTRFVEALGVPRGDGAPWWSRAFEVRGAKVHVAALDTAWASCCDEDKGRLLVSRFQAHATLAGADRADVAIALMHHPWDDLAEFDAREVREAVTRRCAITLRGHLHQADGRAVRRPDLAALELAAGASYAGSKYPNAYHLLEIDAVPGAPPKAARVHMRRWDDHDWLADRNAYRGHAPDGVARFELG